MVLKLGFVYLWVENGFVFVHNIYSSGSTWVLF